jgi:hypothetical protein
MAYTYNIPQPTDQLSVSQDQILQNFTALGAIAGNTQSGSASLNVVPGVGFNFVNMALQGATPVFNGNNGFWSQLYAGTGGVGEIWVNNRNGNQYPMTAGILSLNPTITSNNNGWSYLASGVILKWGASTVTANSSTPISFTGTNLGPAFNQCFQAVATLGAATPQSVSIVVVSAASMNVIASAGGSVRWFAIGRE